MFSNHVVTQEQFDQLKERVNDVINEYKVDSSILDPVIAITIMQLNQLDDIVTIFSCEGHPVGYKRDAGYIMLATTNPDKLYRLHQLILDQVVSENTVELGQHEYELATSRAIWPVNYDKNNITWYNVFILRWGVYNDIGAANYFRPIRQAVDLFTTTYKD